MINLAEDIKPISYVKIHTADVLKQIEEKNNPVVITQNGEAKVVLMNVHYYQNPGTLCAMAARRDAYI
jgi:prevent-host-death family protein